MFFLFFQRMASESTLSAVGDGHNLGDPTSPLEATGTKRAPLDLSLLDEVDDSMADMGLSSKSKNSKILRCSYWPKKGRNSVS